MVEQELMADSNVDELSAHCVEMAAILGLDEPVPEAALRAAIADESYAHNLLVSRGHQEFLGHLLANPPAVRPGGAESIGGMQLVKSATQSLARWARTGFSTVDESTYQKRLSGCAECHHLQAPPEARRILYRLAGTVGQGRAVCGECGCVVTVKARRVSDTCPVAHPEQQGLNRWLEPHGE
jgi:hypothetical protein